MTMMAKQWEVFLVIVLLLFSSPFVVIVVNSEEITCGVWFAKSTIPGAGLGMFAGKDFAEHEDLLPAGDVVIPLVDMNFHLAQTTDDTFLWDEYTWDADKLLMGLEGFSSEIDAASPGFGAAINCLMDLVNVKEKNPITSNEGGLHRSTDPGIGGFSPYWNRTAVAMEPIMAGQELFASYGNNWFTTRKDMATVPLKGDLRKANNLLRSLKSMTEKLEPTFPSEVLKDLWESFVWENPWHKSSRILSAVPRTWDETRIAMNISLRSLKRRHHSVSVEWLKENGECGDWITVKTSTIRQAGRGAYARRPFKAGEIVAPLPLIHVPYRSILDMFEFASLGRKPKIDREKKFHTQLLENYCMGHRESTLLLCPFGTLSNHINHNQTLANVKLVWAEPSKSSHNHDWLNMTVDELHSTYRAGLAMNIIAIRDIRSDEEIFLDYGFEWEKAWQQHIDTWAPVDGAEHYKSAEELNMDPESIKTELELLSEPYPNSVKLYISKGFAGARDGWLPHWKHGTLDQFILKHNEYVNVNVLHRESDRYGNTWYTVSLPRKHKKPKKVSKVPVEAFRFFDQAYTTDMFQSNSFRHDIRIPDHLFPEAWKNLRSSVESHDHVNLSCLVQSSPLGGASSYGSESWDVHLSSA